MEFIGGVCDLFGAKQKFRYRVYRILPPVSPAAEYDKANNYNNYFNVIPIKL